MAFMQRYGPWAIVAGASEGTGRCFVDEIARHGVNCIMIANGGPLEEAAEEVRAQHGVECVTARIDLSSAEAFAEIREVTGNREIGLYVANAGADPFGVPFHDRAVADWMGLINLNITATTQACHHFGGLMRSRGHGGLLLVTSGACYGGGYVLAIYTAVKAYLLNFAESLWCELKPQGVDVLTLVLGQTDTPGFRVRRTAKGQPIPEHIDAAKDVARQGIAELANGPVSHAGLKDDEKGQMSFTAAERRERARQMTAAIGKQYGLTVPV